MSSDMCLATDASSFGIGAVCGQAWFSAHIPHALSDLHINILELFAAFASVAVWGSRWANKRVLFLCDNSSVVQVASAGTCRDIIMMRILRAMFLLTARHNIRLSFEHIPGTSNFHADLLSRLQVQQFRHFMPLADAVPT